MNLKKELNDKVNSLKANDNSSTRSSYLDRLYAVLTGTNTDEILTLTFNESGTLTAMILEDPNLETDLTYDSNVDDKLSKKYKVFR